MRKLPDSIRLGITRRFLLNCLFRLLPVQAICLPNNAAQVEDWNATACNLLQNPRAFSDLRRNGRDQPYQLYLESNLWRRYARAWKLHLTPCCEICGSRDHLQVHHKTYEVDGQRIVGVEVAFIDALQTLCAKCHRKEHGL